jgi:hypothetical protein
MGKNIKAVSNDMARQLNLTITDAKNSNDDETQTEIEAILSDTVILSRISRLLIAYGGERNDGEQNAFPL